MNSGTLDCKKAKNFQIKALESFNTEYQLFIIQFSGYIDKLLILKLNQYFKVTQGIKFV